MCFRCSRATAQQHWGCWRGIIIGWFVLWSLHIDRAGYQRYALVRTGGQLSANNREVIVRADNCRGGDGAVPVSAALSSGQCTLSRLAMDGNNISDKGAESLSGALSSGHCTLTELNISSMRLLPRGWVPQIVR